MRYVTLAEAFLLAETVTGIEAHTLIRISQTHLLDSALHAPQESFDERDMYPTIFDKAAILCIRIALNHPLLDGNKRLAWTSMRFFCDVNNTELIFDDQEAIEVMLLVANGSMSAQQLSAHIRRWADTANQ